MSSVVVIGGGAAGMAAAIAAAMCGDRVIVLEHMDRVGKKLLATGNGRCNLMNAGQLRYPGGGSFAGEVLTRCGAQEQKRFWHTLGLRIRQEDGGRIYPVSGAASTVLDTLRQAMRLLDVEIVTNANVNSIRRTNKGWAVEADRVYNAHRVIVAGGGCAQPKLGSNGSAYDLLTALGHTMTELKPALTQIITDTSPIRGLSGIRARCRVSITNGNGEKVRQNGELLFADYGVTGVCVMQCARWAESGDIFHIDLTRAMGLENAQELLAELQRRRDTWGEGMTALDLLTGLCVPKLAQVLMKQAGIDRAGDRPAGSLNARQLREICALAEDFTLRIRGVKDFENAQVTAGGLCCCEFDANTMASRLVPGIHAAGEILDVDGDCGGFNLMFAFGSGILAGLNGRKIPW
ncbi:MAG: aminoacetone oxidase family FAD-binding enzyme [Clostridia bacterium]|nr:aminoacetone oxidase family FAD-binding enzyme [Clostridia bacterium]